MPISEDSTRRIIATFDAAKSRRLQVEHLWDDITDLVAPTRSTREDDFHTPGRDRSLMMYDNTAKISADLLAADMHGRTVSSNVPWFGLRPVDPRLSIDFDKDVEQWVESVQAVLLAVFNSPRTGFMTATHEIFQDAVSFGTASALRQDFGGTELVFEARHLFESYFHTDAKGRVSTQFRKLMLTPSQAADLLGQENLSERVRAQLNEKERYTSRSPYLHMVGPRSDRDLSRVDAKNMPIASVYIDLEAKRPVLESGFMKMPVSAVRWAVASGEVEGTSPAIKCIDDIRMAQAIAKSQIGAKAKASDPPLLVNDADVFGSLDNVPGGVTYKRRDGAVEVIPTGDARPGDEMLADTRASIRQGFFADKIEIPQNDRMTTSEVIERSMAGIRAFSPFTSRLQMEYFTPTVEWTVFKAIEKGWVDAPPARLRDAGGMTVEYVSPLVLNQRLAEAQSVNLWIQSLLPIAGVDKAVLEEMGVEVANIPGLLARGLNVPSSAIRDPVLVRQANEQKRVLQETINEAAAVQQVAAAAEGASAATETVANTLQLVA